MDHKILLMKLKALGLQKPVVIWFQAYLSDRLQCVEVSDVKSSPASVICGVPQGSILVPMLFLIYVNDMPSVVKCKLLLYADDSVLLVAGKSVVDIQRLLSS